MPTDTVIEDSDHYGSKFINRNDRYTRNYKALDRQYQPWQAAYRDIADFIAVGRGRFMDRGELANQKTKAAEKIINPTAPEALRMLGAGLHGGLSSPARPWFQLQFVDPGMNEFKAYREWLDACEKVMYSEFKSSAFYTIVHSIYEEIGGFGTGTLFMDADPSGGFSFHDFTAGDYRFAVGSDKLTKHWYRKYRQQACSVADDFGLENISDKVKTLLDSNPYEWVTIYHVIEPNNDYDEGKIDSKKFRSIYFEAKEPDLRLLETGYNEMPVVTPRWQALSNEAYGWGPGLDALGLAMAIQRSEEDSFLAGDKALSPPLGVPASMKDRMLDLSPHAKNVYEPNEGQIVPLVQVDLNALQYYDAKIMNNENRIKRIFFNELFLMIANADERMTATEVLARNEEKMLMIGPTIERLEYEFLDPLVMRGFNILFRQEKLPPAPQELESVEYKIEYISILARAQKLISNQTMQTYLGTAERVAAIDPVSAEKTNWDEFLAEVADTVSLPAKILRSKDELDKMRAAREAKQQEMEELAKAESQTGSLKTLSETQTAGNSTALADIQETMGNA
jgi:hypothetical protein